MKIHIYYQELDLGMGGCPPVYVCDADNLVEARVFAKDDCKMKGRILSSYTWRKGGDLFPRKS